MKSGSTVLKAYTYDGGNRKITEDDGTTVTQLVYSAAWQVLEEKVGSSYTNRYVWSPVYADALVLRDDGTQRVWAIQDANWNVTALVDDSGNVLERFGYDDPYGKVTAYDASWTVKSGGSGYAWVITFQGMRYDETTGNFYQRMRWYSPTLGRWITVDPMRFGAGDANLYRFVGGSSTSKLDPSGLAEFDPLGIPVEQQMLKANFKKGDFRFKNNPVQAIVNDVSTAYGYVLRAWVRMDELVARRCKKGPHAQLTQWERNRIEYYSKTAGKWFDAKDGCPNCEQLEKIRDNLWKMLKSFKNGSLHFLAKSDNQMSKSGAIAETETKTGYITFNIDIHFGQTHLERVSTLIHEMTHKELNTEDWGYYNGNGSGRDALYDSGNLEIALNLIHKLDNASTYEFFIMEMGVPAEELMKFTKPKG